jgi:hypothetical protein
LKEEKLPDAVYTKSGQDHCPPDSCLHGHKNEEKKGTAETPVKFPRWVVRDKCRRFALRMTTIAETDASRWHSWGKCVQWATIRMRLVTNRKDNIDEDIEKAKDGWRISASASNHKIEMFQARIVNAWKGRLYRIALNLNTDSGNRPNQDLFSMRATAEISRLNKRKGNERIARPDQWLEAFHRCWLYFHRVRSKRSGHSRSWKLRHSLIIARFREEWEVCMIRNVRRLRFGSSTLVNPSHLDA